MESVFQGGFLSFLPLYRSAWLIIIDRNYAFWHLKGGVEIPREVHYYMAYFMGTTTAAAILQLNISYTAL